MNSYSYCQATLIYNTTFNVIFLVFILVKSMPARRISKEKNTKLYLLTRHIVFPCKSLHQYLLDELLKSTPRSKHLPLEEEIFLVDVCILLAIRTLKVLDKQCSSAGSDEASERIFLLLFTYYLRDEHLKSKPCSTQLRMNFILKSLTSSMISM